MSPSLALYNYSTRRMCLLSRRYCRFNHISARYIHRRLACRLGILDIDTYVTRRHPRWAGHVARMSEDRLPRRFLSCWVRNKRPTGCPHFTYARGLFKSLKKVDVERAAWYDLAQERELWRKLIAKQFTEKI